jgi:3-methyladenine DNA glycosylase/8-oxoguanine DNA glycosylase
MPRLEAVSGQDPAALGRRLQRIRGIGPWTAAIVTAVVLGDPDAVPVGDYHLPNTVAWWLADEPRATDERMLELLEPYQGHRWRVIRMAKATGGAPKYGPKLSLTGDGLHLGR